MPKPQGIVKAFNMGITHGYQRVYKSLEIICTYIFLDRESTAFIQFPEGSLCPKKKLKTSVLKY